MKQTENRRVLRAPAAAGLLALALIQLACGRSTPPEPAVVVAPTAVEQVAAESTATSAAAAEAPAPPALEAPVDLDGDGTIGICEAVPPGVWEQVMGRDLVGDPEPFSDPALGEGCAFDFGSDSSAAYFAYVTFASEDQFNQALATAVNAEPVTTLADSAFLNYGADARQLWVAEYGEGAILVAIGDRENVAGAMTVAPYLLQALP